MRPLVYLYAAVDCKTTTADLYFSVTHVYLAGTRTLARYYVHTLQHIRLTASATVRPFCTQPCRLTDSFHARRSIGEHEPSVEHWILSRLGHVVCAVTFVHFARIRALVDKHLPDICDALECLSVSPTSEVAVNQTASMLMPSVLKMSRRSSALSGRCERMSALIAQTCSSSLVRQHLSARLHAKMLDIDSISPRFRLERCISGRT